MKRNFGLDLIRAFSICLVLFQHGKMNIPGLAPMKIGSVGVEIFFVLSGFLIGGILFKEIDKNQGFFATLKNFWVRRWFRILPLYYAVLLFKFIFIDDSIGWNILYYIFFLQNNFYGIDYLGVSWSLVIEEWFYLFTPIFLLMLTALFKKQKHIILSLLAFVVFVNIARLAYVIQGNVPWEGVNGNFPFRFDSLFLGVILAFLKMYRKDFFIRLSKPIVSILGLGIFVGYLFYYRSMAFPVNQINELLLPRTLGFFILPFSISLIIPYISTFKSFENKSFLGRAFFQAVTRMSLYTYALYLIHPFIFENVYINDFFLKIDWQRFLFSVSISFVLAGLVYHLFERPILKYRDRITS